MTSGPVVASFSLSLDGFIAGPDDRAAAPLGEGGERLFAWWQAGDEPILGDDRFRPPARSRSVVEQSFDLGAIVTGRRTFDLAGGWGGSHPIGAPFFLLTHRPVDRHVGPGTGGTVVDGGIERALKLAREAAEGRAIGVCGASVAQQFLAAGLLDELHLTVVPVLLGAGVPLFDPARPHRGELDQVAVVESDQVVHLAYRVRR